MPADANWRVECGPLGFKIVFGDGDASPEIVLSAVRPKGDDCADLSHAAARSMSAMVQGR